MSPLNSTFFRNTSIVRPDFFFISGLAVIPHIKFYYVFLCFVYALTLLGNTFVMFMIYTDHCLHSPKYIAVFNLALCDLCGSTACIPQMIDTFLFKSQLISFEACLTNLYFVFFFIALQSFTLTVLSYDRCVAICVPLRYNDIVTSRSILVIIAILWIFAGVIILVAVVFITTLSFCKSTVIDSYICDHGPIWRLACNDNTPSRMINWTHSFVILWCPVLFITGTYICIGVALLKIAVASERLKAMQTCTSHLILVSVFYLPICINGAMGSSMHQHKRIINMSLTTVLPPVLNPIIYTLKTEEFRESIKKLYRRNKINVTKVAVTFGKCFSKMRHKCPFGNPLLTFTLQFTISAHKEERTHAGFTGGTDQRAQKWPKAVEEREWETVNNDPTKISEQQVGTAEKKLERMGNIIYHYGEERFGVNIRRSDKATPAPAKSRRQQEIERLVEKTSRERRQLRKQWKKVSDAERDGLMLLQGDIKCRLATLRRAENLRKLRKRKEHTRTWFYKNPFKI
ncbi:olfactory receptor 1F1-like [Conger conger]|uniref:olfactory receptor 1F1-like n=1 Tax=Conger conger TaxID=82655 RepID=UPI002A5A6807|nr:olfactory receptor 1F1-like [Conger conger]